MKKVLLTLAAMTAFVANAQNKQLVSIENYNVAEDGAETLSSVTESAFYEKRLRITGELQSVEVALVLHAGLRPMPIPRLTSMMQMAILSRRLPRPAVMWNMMAMSMDITRI